MFHRREMKAHREETLQLIPVLFYPRRRRKVIGMLEAGNDFDGVVVRSHRITTAVAGTRYTWTLSGDR